MFRSIAESHFLTNLERQIPAVTVEIEFSKAGARWDSVKISTAVVATQGHGIPCCRGPLGRQANVGRCGRVDVCSGSKCRGIYSQGSLVALLRFLKEAKHNYQSTSLIGPTVVISRVNLFILTRGISFWIEREVIARY